MNITLSFWPRGNTQDGLQAQATEETHLGRKDNHPQRRPAAQQPGSAHSPPPLRLADFPLPLPLALSLPLLFDFVKRQDVSLLFAFRFSILTLGALFTKIGLLMSEK